MQFVLVVPELNGSEQEMQYVIVNAFLDKVTFESTESIARNGARTGVDKQKKAREQKVFMRLDSLGTWAWVSGLGQ